MAEKANKFVLRGIVSGFVNMLKPDTKFNPAGEYKISMLVQKNDPRLKPVLDEISKVMGPALKKFKDEQAKQPPAKRHRGELHESLPYVDMEDGTLLFKFKSIASGTSAKTGEPWERVIPHFGADGRIDPKQVPAYGEGSEVGISFTINGFANKVAGNGASLRLEQVKLFTIEKFGGGGASSDFGDEDEGGYRADSNAPEEESWGEEVPTADEQF